MLGWNCKATVSRLRKMVSDFYEAVVKLRLKYCI